MKQGAAQNCRGNRLPQQRPVRDAGRLVGGRLRDLDLGPKARPSEREAQFIRLREQIEACAGRKYQATEFEGTPPGIVLRSIDFRG
jgi:hypothetical protein